MASSTSSRLVFDSLIIGFGSLVFGSERFGSERFNSESTCVDCKHPGRLLGSRQRKANPTITIRAMPPTMPPTIAPVCDEPDDGGLGGMVVVGPGTLVVVNVGIAGPVPVTSGESWSRES